jgi:carbonic anhydrase
LTGDSNLDTDGFFEDFQQKSDGETTIDISKLLDVGAILKSYVIGYIGTDTMPLCAKKVCWYIYKTHFKITQAELDFFKKGGPDSNYRAANTALPKEYNKFYYYQGYAAPKN